MHHSLHRNRTKRVERRCEKENHAECEAFAEPNAVLAQGIDQVMDYSTHAHNDKSQQSNDIQDQEWRSTADHRRKEDGESDDKGGDKD